MDQCARLQKAFDAAGKTVADYAKSNGIEHTISDRILPILNVGPLHTLTPHQLRIVMHLLQVVAIYPPHGARA